MTNLQLRDLIREIALMAASMITSGVVPHHRLYGSILRAVHDSDEVLTAPAIAKQLHMPLARVSAMLAELETHGLVSCMPGRGVDKQDAWVVFPGLVITRTACRMHLMRERLLKNLFSGRSRDDVYACASTASQCVGAESGKTYSALDCLTSPTQFRCPQGCGRQMKPSSGVNPRALYLLRQFNVSTRPLANALREAVRRFTHDPVDGDYIDIDLEVEITRRHGDAPPWSAVKAEMRSMLHPEARPNPRPRLRRRKTCWCHHAFRKRQRRGRETNV